MTTALLTLDESDASHYAALTATTLFGPDTEYLAVHVSSAVPPVEFLGGSVYGYPYPAVTTASLADPTRRRQAIQDARDVAATLASKAEVAATPIGETGDPATAIARVAHTHAADVVVVGDHDRSWFRKLLEGSVAEQLLAQVSIPVLVVPLPADGT